MIKKLGFSTKKFSGLLSENLSLGPDSVKHTSKKISEKKKVRVVEWGWTCGEGGYEGHLVLGVGGEQGRVQQLAVLKHLAHPA
jgi:hypothetical protein